MKARSIFVNALKIGIPVALGIYLVVYVYQSLTPSEKADLFTAFGQVNYWWIAVSILMAILSHASRAHRWSYLLEPLGHKPGFMNGFYSVMIGYIANLAFPRIGEVTRCGFMSRYEKIPFNHLFGTVIAERIFDMSILLVVVTVILATQIEILGGMLESILPASFSGDGVTFLLILAGGGILIGVLVLILIWRSSHPWALKFRTLITGFAEGLRSVATMQQKGWFIAHTLFIWAMYLGMFYVALLSIPSVANVSFMGMVAAFMMGSISIVFVQGGIGVYPVAIMQALVLYGVGKADGLAMGWIIWSTQTAMIIVFGALSLILMPLTNKSNDGQV